MKKSLPLLLCLFLFNLQLNAQFADARCLLDEDLSNFSITRVMDGFTVAGTTNNANGGNTDLRVISFGFAGNIIWSRTYSGDFTDRAFHIEAIDDGYVITGFTRSNTGEGRLFFLRIDNQGEIVTNRRFIDPRRPDWRLTGLHVLPVNFNSGFLITGYNNQFGLQVNSPKSTFVMLLDDQADIVWARYYDSPNDGDSDFDMASFALEVGDGFFITGSSNVFKTGGGSNQGVMAMRIDDSGNIMWNNNFAIDLADQWEENRDVGTSAILDENEIVVLANSTLDNSFYITRLDVNTGMVLGNHNNYRPLDEVNTSSFSLGQTQWGSIIVGGMIPESATAFDCNGLPSEFGAVSFICQLTSSLETVMRAQVYMTPNQDFATSEGSIYNSHFGGPANLNAPLIATPEMVDVDPNSNDIGILAYRQDRVSGAGNYDLQFIGTSAPDFEWCNTRPIEFQHTTENAVYDENIRAGALLTLDEDDAFVTASDTIEAVTCQDNGFPIRINEVDTFDNITATGKSRTLRYLDEETYVVGMRANTCGANGQSHPFATKHDAEGNLLFEITASTTQQPANHSVTGIEVDANRDIYIAGGLGPGNLTWQGAPQIVAPTTSTGLTRTSYIAKYDANGNYLWQVVLRPVGTLASSLVDILDFQIGPGGLLYVTGIGSGFLESETDFGGVTTTGSPFFMSFNGTDRTAFVARYDPNNGNLLGIRFDQIPGQEFQGFISRRIEIDLLNGNLYMVGHKNGAVKVRQLDNNLNDIPGTWTSKSSAVSAGNPLVITSALQDNVLYIGGECDSTIQFDNLTINESDNFRFIVRLDLDMNPPLFTAATKITTSAGFLNITDLLAMPTGNEVYALGTTWGSSTTYAPAGGTLNNTGEISSIYMVKYDEQLDNASFTPLWPHHYTGAGTEAWAGSLALDNLNCGVVFSGSFSKGDINLGYPNIMAQPTSAGPNCSAIPSDVFVARAGNIDRFAYKTNNPYMNNSSIITRKIEPEEKEEINVYPNPSKGLFFISGDEVYEVVITDLTGRIVWEGNNVQGILDVSGLPNGFYNATISNAGEVANVKLLKQ